MRMLFGKDFLERGDPSPSNIYQNICFLQLGELINYLSKYRQNNLLGW